MEDPFVNVNYIYPCGEYMMRYDVRRADEWVNIFQAFQGQLFFFLSWKNMKMKDSNFLYLGDWVPILARIYVFVILIHCIYSAYVEWII